MYEHARAKKKTNLRKMSYLRVNETKLKKKDFHVFHRKNDQITVECPECIEFRIN